MINTHEQVVKCQSTRFDALVLTNELPPLDGILTKRSSKFENQFENQQTYIDHLRHHIVFNCCPAFSCVKQT